jgi:hypothetical protein
MSQPKNKGHYRHGRRQKPWPLILLVAGGVLLIFVAVSVLNKPSKPQPAIEVSGSPSLKVDKQKVDLGNIKLGRVVDVSFELTNVGDQTLRFSKTPYIEVVEGC